MPAETTGWTRMLSFTTASNMGRLVRSAVKIMPFRFATTPIMPLFSGTHVQAILPKVQVSLVYHTLELHVACEMPHDMHAAAVNTSSMHIHQ